MNLALALSCIRTYVSKSDHQSLPKVLRFRHAADNLGSRPNIFKGEKVSLVSNVGKTCFFPQKIFIG